MPKQIHPATKKSRYNKIMKLQQEISRENLKNKIGTTQKARIDGITKNQKYYVGRTYMDVPEIDGVVYIKNTKQLNLGDWVDCKIKEVKDYDGIEIDKEGRTRLHSIRLYDEHFTLCKRCKAINYYTNKTCVLCNSSDIDTDDLHDIAIHYEIIDIYDTYINAGFNINDIDDIKITTVKVDNINIRDGKKDFKLNNRLLKNKTKYI